MKNPRVIFFSTVQILCQPQGAFDFLRGWFEGGGEREIPLAFRAYVARANGEKKDRGGAGGIVATQSVAIRYGPRYGVVEPRAIRIPDNDRPEPRYLPNPARGTSR